MKFFFYSVIVILLMDGCTSRSSIDDIVIVDVYSDDRLSIIQELQTICALNPKVVAVDVQFLDVKYDSVDLLLKMTLKYCGNVVLPSLIKDYTAEDSNYESIPGTDPYFLDVAETGFINTLYDYADEEPVLKVFSIKETINNKIEYHFSVQTAMCFDSVKTISFMKDKPKILDVKFQKRSSNFKKISASRVLSNDIKPEEIKGKIVLLGQISIRHNDEDPDLFTVSKGSQPMWGVEYLANIIVQILDD